MPAPFSHVLWHSPLTTYACVCVVYQVRALTPHVARLLREFAEDAEEFGDEDAPLPSAESVDITLVDSRGRERPLRPIDNPGEVIRKLGGIKAVQLRSLRR